MKPTLVFLSDFTYMEGAVAAMYGVVKSVDRQLEIIDGTHQLPHFDTWSASYRLMQIMPFWPKETIFVCVVDPGVGTERRACVARASNGQYVVTPDNGTLTHINNSIGIDEVRQIDLSVNRLRSTAGTSVFHGRDVFAYTAARLASGAIDFPGVGPSYDTADIVLHDIPKAQKTPGGIRGIFEIADPNFGNLWSNIDADAFRQAGFTCGDSVHVAVLHGGQSAYEADVRFAETFGQVARGEPVIYVNELMRIACALSCDNMLAKYALGFGREWEVIFTKKEGQK